MKMRNGSIILAGLFIVSFCSREAHADTNMFSSVELVDNQICFTLPQHGIRWMIKSDAGLNRTEYGQRICLTNREVIILAEKHSSNRVSAELNPDQTGLNILSDTTMYSPGGGHTQEAWFVEVSNFGLSKDISPEQAVGIAESESRKVMNIPTGLRPIIIKTNGNFLITYPVTLPEDTLGPDYYTQVTIDAKSGKVLLLLGPQD